MFILKTCCLRIEIHYIFQNRRIVLDNNLTENEIHPFMLGRKNYLFCGNLEAVQNMAVVCSLLATYRNHEVNPRDFLNDVITQMHNTPKLHLNSCCNSASQVEDYTPAI